MCHGYWISDPFWVEDPQEFQDWLSIYWPQVHVVPRGDNEFQIGNSSGYYDGYGYQLPDQRYNPDEDDYDDCYNDEFLEELSYRVSRGTACFIKTVMEYCEDDAVHVTGYVINGGDAPFEERWSMIDLNHIMAQRATDLAGGQLLLGYAA